ncbi:hypothetical protein RZS08_41480, partial [Arthrospira platensis SPKY1]|nr:hypothetical protein [Arthrospira platensis SPKY1]
RARAHPRHAAHQAASARAGDPGLEERSGAGGLLPPRGLRRVLGTGSRRHATTRARAGCARLALLVGGLVGGLLALASAPLAAQQPLEVRLEAPDTVRPVLERHVRLLRREDRVLPE